MKYCIDKINNKEYVLDTNNTAVGDDNNTAARLVYEGSIGELLSHVCCVKFDKVLDNIRATEAASVDEMDFVDAYSSKFTAWLSCVTNNVSQLLVQVLSELDMGADKPMKSVYDLLVGQLLSVDTVYMGKLTTAVAQLKKLCVYINNGQADDKFTDVSFYLGFLESNVYKDNSGILTTMLESKQNKRVHLLIHDNSNSALSGMSEVAVTLDGDMGKLKRMISYGESYDCNSVVDLCAFSFLVTLVGGKTSRDVLRLKNTMGFKF